MTIIDTHHHFWKYSPEEYGWISDAMSALRRDFLPADLKRELDAAQVTGAISVQARQSLAETDLNALDPRIATQAVAHGTTATG